ncbi:nucleoside diphosphate phosphatase ENTPD5 [Pelobates fuscus]|uniref:nucleoside diphosphate phosphatase ENTPD5 n=1 Tax=Pelobates fuscus TaxID=191477 RepID=UPI002FE4DAE7
MRWRISFISTSWSMCLILTAFCSSVIDEHSLPSAMHRQISDSIYGIVFDAGTTGTRIHVYTFTQKTTGSPLQLLGEVFESVKPGLSSFAYQPEKGADTVRMLLDLAQNVVPGTHWHRTPVIFKATAGLRLLPEHQAEALLSEVRRILRKSPFLVPDDSVSIMDGTDEGILAWIAVNFLTGRLNGHHTVGIIDLGGGSTQVTFLPLSKATFDETPPRFLSTFELFNSTYRLYTHSYLGLGLKVARLAILGASASQVQQNQTFRSHCLPQAFNSEWNFAGVTYRYGGMSDGSTGFSACYSEVLPVVKGKVHRVAEILNTQFYAFSYFYDRAAECDLIDYTEGGTVEVRDFARKAEEVCENMARYSSLSPFLCMDLTYISALLQEGLGFEDQTPVLLRKKMHHVEISWTLGAILQVLWPMH